MIAYIVSLIIFIFALAGVFMGLQLKNDFLVGVFALVALAPIVAILVHRATSPKSKKIH